MSTPEGKAQVLDDLKRLLGPLGYRKAGALFSLDFHDVVHLVGVQSSQASTAKQTQLTIDLGVFAPALVDSDVREHTKPSIAEAHWRQRLGFVMPERQDRWWSIASAAEARSVGAQMAAALATHGLKALAGIPDLGALKRLWNSGSSPGLTERQRQRCLERLEKVSPPEGK
jgi:hypothetical protein